MAPTHIIQCLLYDINGYVENFWLCLDWVRTLIEQIFVSIAEKSNFCPLKQRSSNLFCIFKILIEAVDP